MIEPFAIYTGTKGEAMQRNGGGKVTEAEVINRQTMRCREEPGFPLWYDNQERQNFLKVGSQQDSRE